MTGWKADTKKYWIKKDARKKKREEARMCTIPVVLGERKRCFVTPFFVVRVIQQEPIRLRKSQRDEKRKAKTSLERENKVKAYTGAALAAWLLRLVMAVFAVVV